MSGSLLALSADQTMTSFKTMAIQVLYSLNCVTTVPLQGRPTKLPSGDEACQLESWSFLFLEMPFIFLLLEKNCSFVLSRSRLEAYL
jgi:hypothetical protein